MRQLRAKHIKRFREWQLKRQKGVCPICGELVTDPVLDHSHQKKVGGTGLVRGVICRGCNVFLAKMENNWVRCGLKKHDIGEVLRRCADYLTAPGLPYIHPSERKRQILKKSSYNQLRRVYTGKAKFPEYPSREITVRLRQLFEEYGITPQWY